jgi:hypothetical protein
MPLAPKIDPPEVSRSSPLTSTGNWSGFYQKWLTQVYRAILYLLGGTAQSTHAKLGTFASSLDAQDVGIQVVVTDYGHVLEWNGTGWAFAPGDGGGGFIVPFVTPTMAPASPVGWKLCDGSNQPYLKADGTLGTAVLPVTPGSWFRQ